MTDPNRVVLDVLALLERQHAGEDVDAELSAALEPLNTEQGASVLASALRLLWVAVANTARVYRISHRQAVEEFEQFVTKEVATP